MAWAVLAWLMIALLPGIAIVRLVGMPGPALGPAAAAPLSLGFVYLTGLAATRAGAPVLATCLVGVGLLVVGWLAVEVVRHRRRRALPADRDPAPDAPAGRLRSRLAACSTSVACSWALLLLAIGTGVALWALLHALLTMPAGWDAMHHGYFIRQIVDHDTLDARVVLSSDPARADGTTSFYPLAPDLAIAVLHVATGIRISTLLLASTVAFGGVVLPLGVYLLSRRLAPDRPLVAGFAALASVLPADLFTIEYTGRLTAVLGIALVPAAAAVLVNLGGPRDWRTPALGALALVGVIGAHTTEVPVVLALAVACVAVYAARSGHWRRLPWWLAGSAAAVTLAALVLAAAEPGLRHMATERADAFHAAPESPPTVVEAIRMTLASASYPPQAVRPMAVWSALAVAGCLLTVHRRWRPLAGPAIAYVGFAAFVVTWWTGHLRALAVLGDPWYRNTGRMLWELCALGAIPAGVCLAAAAVLTRGAVRRGISLVGGLRGREPAGLPVPARWASALVATAAAATCALVFARPPALAISGWLWASASPVDRDAVAAFRYLAAHVGPGGRVLDDLESRGELWMYVDERVPTLLGNPPLLGHAPPSWQERLYLRGQLSHIGTDPCVSDLLARYRVRYVYYSGTAMSGGHTRIRSRLLGDERYFREVFSAGASRVYRIVRPAPRGPCDRSLTAMYPWNTPADVR